MTKVLSTYVNCSLGGMTSVYRSRGLNHEDTQYDLVFTASQGGEQAFSGLDNCNVRICQKQDMASYLEYSLRATEYDLFTVTSQPWLIDSVEVPDRTHIVYEIHSPLEHIVRRELEALDTSSVDEIWVPSAWSADLVARILPRRKHVPITVHANEVDATRFNVTGSRQYPLHGRTGMIPVSWIGRLENFHKNYIDFMRVVKALPENYYGIMLLSLQNDPAGLSKAIGAAAALGVAERLDLLWNVPQQRVGDLHRTVRDAGGVFCSTALYESFGYGVVEAALCGTPVAAYDVGPLSDHKYRNIQLVPIGDLMGLAQAILDCSNPEVADGANDAVFKINQVDGVHK